MPIERSEGLQRMREALLEGKSFNLYQREAIEGEYSYTRSRMLQDWRDTAETLSVEGHLRFVGRGRYATPDQVAQVAYDQAEGFYYKVKYETAFQPGGPLETRWITIRTESPFTRAEVEREALEALAGERYQEFGVLESMTPWTAIQNVRA